MLKIIPPISEEIKQNLIQTLSKEIILSSSLSKTNPLSSLSAQILLKRAAYSKNNLKA